MNNWALLYLKKKLYNNFNNTVYKTSLKFQCHLYRLGNKKKVICNKTMYVFT